MTRAAAKNHAWVTIVTEPDAVRAAAHRAARQRRHRRRRDRAARSRSRRSPAPPRTTPRSSHGSRTTSCCPRTSSLALERTDETLRYGENPHQHGARYRRAGHDELVGRPSSQHGGLALSYLNYYDADAAWKLVHDLGDRPGVRDHQARQPVRRRASTTRSPTAYQRALECDERPRSAASSR